MLKLKEVCDISIPVSFGKKQLVAFDGPPAKRHAYHAGHFVGDVRKGGSCNCEVYTFSPHLNGTHTEGVGHITKERIAVPNVGLVMATMITVKPKNGLITKDMLHSPHRHSREGGNPSGSNNHKIPAFAGMTLGGGALIIRTLPNDKSKVTRNYSKSAPPHITADAMKHIVKLGVQHLLVDFPSVDKVDDPKLTAHRIFWAKHALKKTITELVYVPSHVKDGQYILNLQVAPFDADAAPSRPVLYKVR